MGTTIRPELSEKNPYWIERHRYYELKHFCLQYPIWKKAYTALDGLSRRPSDLEIFSKKGEISDPTVRCVEARSYYIERMKTVEQAAIATDAELSNYILKGVTEGWSYDILKARLNIPCCKDVYYNLYRRFFWLLNKARDWNENCRHSSQESLPFQLSELPEPSGSRQQRSGRYWRKSMQIPLSSMSKRTIYCLVRHAKEDRV